MNNYKLLSSNDFENSEKYNEYIDMMICVKNYYYKKGFDISNVPDINTNNQKIINKIVKKYNKICTEKKYVNKNVVRNVNITDFNNYDDFIFYTKKIEYVKMFLMDNETQYEDINIQQVYLSHPSIIEWVNNMYKYIDKLDKYQEQISV
jgi:hypothetical protein